MNIDELEGLPPPDDQSVSYAVQHMQSKNEAIYNEGFEKARSWCRSLPEWTIKHAAIKGEPLTEVLVSFALDHSVKLGGRAGAALLSLATLAQSRAGREHLKSEDRALRAALQILRKGDELCPAAKISATLFLQNLAVDNRAKEQIRIAGGIRALLPLLAPPGDGSFEVPFQAAGALMNLMNSKPCMDEMRRRGAKERLDELQRSLACLEDSTALHTAVLSRVRYIQVNMQINPPDAMVIKLVDPALLAKDIGSVQGRRKLGQERTPSEKKIEQHDKEIPAEEIADAVTSTLEEMQVKSRAAVDKTHKKYDDGWSPWGTVFSKYFKKTQVKR
uniref:Uncharacterized protein n=1 Tax=Tetraselmis sp. GSL018 TaxID=582737 RepID=A0A061RLW8_9CHLO|mmetsp:Transcript_12097/g.28682  ORF Transcript_12097/g.28682 Transcript_12097/m.28682 type:complete len:332 (+) Transcript_12097:268-1263(+)|eukprot:CAMPEP_0177580642 /NCGR_PEP_ID=MMETSP0419_2-20121207/1683_1 /TAXON_ID=582737 /ORGANISM="Tetraselmis sp., Strain GSL018" /LENGTH=331 /DNA_ID=CAMNT_0019069551 /DNA_START=169 /DNA_END=1164 /DNA_ORIENTATION=+